MLKSSDVGELLKEIRHRTGLSQKKLAERLGVSFTSVNRWENGRQKPIPLVKRQIEAIVREMGGDGQDLLNQYFLQ
ncbi:MAG: helix-turn-helix transcriptional regulator [Elainellaceae cyanobacterium]